MSWQHVLAELSRPNIGEHKFDKNWELDNGKKIEVLVFQKVAKTGNIGKKVQWQMISIM